MGLTPTFKITVKTPNGSGDMTAQIRQRLFALKITDQAGIKSDTIEMQLDDNQHTLLTPPTGALLTVWLGYEESGLQKMGLYCVDEVELSSPPQRMTIRAKAANMIHSLKKPKTRTWQKEGKTPPRIRLQDILLKIAAEHGLEAKLSQTFQTIDYEVVHQTNESDLNLLTRLAQPLDAIAKPAQQSLLFVKKGEARSVSGKPLPPLSLSPQDLTRWRVTLAERKNFQSVIARYHNPTQGDERTLTVGDREPTYRIRRLYQQKSEATRAAYHRLQIFQRGKAQLSLELPGNPALFPERPLLLKNFRAEVDGLWRIESLTHSLNEQGFQTSVKGESMT